MEPPKIDQTTNTMDSVLRNVIRQAEEDWGMRPIVNLACQGFEDEHWQVWNPNTWGKQEQPNYVIGKDCEVTQIFSR